MFAKRLKIFEDVIQQCCVTTERDTVTIDDGLRMAHFLLTQMSCVEGKTYVIGNGGSASIASHFCVDLLRTLNLAAVCLSDASMLTCFANDFGYEHVFAKPLERILQAEDVVIAVSSSGQSANMLQAAEVCLKKKGTLMTFTGFSKDNPLRKLGDLNFWVNSSDYGIVEMGHMFLLHTLVDTWELCSKKSKAFTKSAR